VIPDHCARVKVERKGNRNITVKSKEAKKIKENKNTKGN
jgi:hypothetical protein